MENGMNNIVCKSVVEQNWVEYLTFIKEQRVKQKEQQEKNRLARIKRIAEGGDEYLGLSEQCANKEDFGYFYPEISSFWNWYIEHKIELEKK